MVYRFQPALMIAARTAFGILFAGVIGTMSIAVGWGLFVFFGGQSAQVWFTVQLCAAGAGAGLGSIVAWFKVDRNTKLMMTMMAAMAVIGGVAGAWLGYEYGAYKTSLWSAKAGSTIPLSPVTYSVMGSALMANAFMLVFVLAKDVIGRSRQDFAKSRPWDTAASAHEGPDI